MLNYMAYNCVVAIVIVCFHMLFLLLLLMLLLRFFFHLNAIEKKKKQMQHANHPAIFDLLITPKPKRDKRFESQK